MPKNKTNRSRTIKNKVTRSVKPSDLGAEELIEIIDETNKVLLQLDGIRNEMEEFKEDSMSYITDILKKYDLHLKVPAESSPYLIERDIKRINLDETGITVTNLRKGSKKSRNLKEFPLPDFLNILKVAIPHIRTALRLKVKEYESLNEMITKIRETLKL